MTLLEHLSKEVPLHRRNMSDNLRSLIKSHFNEITQAREIGYSWSQILHSMREIWPDICFRSCPAQKIYHQIRKELSK